MPSDGLVVVGFAGVGGARVRYARVCAWVRGATATRKREDEDEDENDDDDDDALRNCVRRAMSVEIA